MCGIAALWGHADQQLTEAIVSKLEHRGPDGLGVHVDPDRHWAIPTTAPRLPMSCAR